MRGALLLLAGLSGCAVPERPAPPAPVAMRSLDGREHRPLEVAPRTLHVLLFLTTDCPIANAYAPTIARLREEFEPQGVRFFLVHVDPRLEPTAALQHAAAYGHRPPILVDRRHELVRAVGATITPEVAVLAPAGVLAYRGRIDDWFGDIGKKRPAPTGHDLRDALRDLLAGRAPRQARTAAIGCDI